MWYILLGILVSLQKHTLVKFLKCNINKFSLFTVLTLYEEKVERNSFFLKVNEKVTTNCIQHRKYL